MPAVPRICLVAGLLLVAMGGSHAQEIAPFRLTGVDGHVSLRYVNDATHTTQRDEMPPSRQSQAGLRNEIFVMTHSYIYHPNLLTLDIGGGPILYGERIAGTSGQNDARGVLYNFSGRATLLRDKPYRANLFYEHLNPTVSIAPGQTLMQENTRYGAEIALLSPVTPIPLQLSFTRSAIRGQGSDRVIDDVNDLFTLNASYSHGAPGTTQFQYQGIQQTSRSGSQNLPIQASSMTSHSMNLDTRLQFGPERQYDLTNIINVNSHRYALASTIYPDLQDTRLLLDMRARHSDKLHTYGNFSYGHSTQGEIDITQKNFSAGTSYWPQSGMEASASIRGEENAGRQYSTRAQGIDGILRYERALPFGTAQIAYSARYDDRAQQALAGQIDVIGERLTLTDSAQITLGHPRVASGTLVISNVARTQVFMPGIDYLITTIGLDTRIQRLIGGAILEGEEILADYAYDAGGTYAYRQLDQTLNLSWSYARYLNVFYRQASKLPRLTSGTPTFPLNEVHSSTFGARGDLPVNPGIALTLGGSFEQENHEETIAPYRRMTADIYVQTDEPLFGIGYFRLTQRKSRTDYGNAAQNVAMRGYDLRYWSRHWFGIDLSASLTGEQDDSGVMPRNRVDGSIAAQWQERKFTLTTSLVSSRETQGDFSRKRTTFQFLARRSF